MPAHPRAEPDHWWLRLGAEPPVPATGCGADDCDTSRILPTDVYCPTHQRPLRTAERPGTGRVRQFAWYALWIVLCVLFVLAAELDTPLPILMAGAIVGAAVVVRPLRRYPTTHSAVAAYWLLACLAMLVLRDAPPTTVPFAVVLAGLALAVALLVHFGNVAIHGGWSGLPRSTPGPDLAPGTGLVAALAGYALAALAALGAAHAARPYAPIPDLVQQAARLTATVAGLATVVLTVAAGAVLAGRAIDRHVHALVRRPRSPTLFTWWPPHRPRRLPRSASFADLVAAAVHDYARHVTRTAVAAFYTITNFLLLLFYLLVLLLTTFLNWAHRQLVISLRRSRAALAASLGVARHATHILLTAAARTARVVLLPAVALAEAAWLVLVMADLGHAYLRDGTPAAVAGMVLTAVAAAVLLTIAWIALSGLPVVRAADSAARSAASATAKGLIFLAVAGWAVGLPGTLGYWHIRVGWVTLTATGIAIIVYLLHLRSLLTRQADEETTTVELSSPDPPSAAAFTWRPAAGPYQAEARTITLDPPTPAVATHAPVSSRNRIAWTATTVALVVAVAACAITLTPTST